MQTKQIKTSPHTHKMLKAIALEFNAPMGRTLTLLMNVIADLIIDSGIESVIPEEFLQTLETRPDNERLRETLIPLVDYVSYKLPTRKKSHHETPQDPICRTQSTRPISEPTSTPEPQGNPLETIELTPGVTPKIE